MCTLNCFISVTRLACSYWKICSQVTDIPVEQTEILVKVLFLYVTVFRATCKKKLLQVARTMPYTL